MNGTITWANGSAMVENFLLSTPDGSDYVPISVDENGTFATYVESGDYIVVVAPLLNGDAITESLRMPPQSMRTRVHGLNSPLPSSKRLRYH